MEESKCRENIPFPCPMFSSGATSAEASPSLPSPRLYFMLLAWGAGGGLGRGSGRSRRHSGDLSRAGSVLGRSLQSASWVTLSLGDTGAVSPYPALLAIDTKLISFQQLFGNKAGTLSSLCLVFCVSWV